MPSTPAPTPEATPTVDADSAADAAKALWQHLHRAGVAMAPQPDEAGVANWRIRLSRSTEPAADQAADPESSSSPASDQNSDRAPRETTPPKPRAKTVAESIEAAARSRLAAVPSTIASPQAYPAALPVVQRTSVLNETADAVAACQRCEELARCRTNTVFGEGDPEARFVFFGEGPGADEDRTGRPFVGRAGELLTKMILACKLTREQVYICNTVKCRPPGNRNPESAEVENCREYFQTQFETIQPEYIVCLGAVAAHALLQTKLGIGRLRQQFHTYRGSKVVVIYHPAYLLRNPDAKKAAWADLQMLMADAGLLP